MMKTILELRGVSKLYPGVVALNKVDMKFLEGEIHSIMGENGAGKSTLIKIISGAIKADEGNVYVEDERLKNITPALAKQKGIGVIYQEFNLIPSMSVVENIFIGEKVGSRFMPDFDKMREKAQGIFDEFGVDIDINEAVGRLSPGKQQLVEIAKALSQNVKIMIMDEPSASISVSDVKILFGIIRKLKEKKVTIIYITHRMEEVFEISDCVSVMRDGEYIATHKVSDTTRKYLVTLMVGRELNETFPKRDTKIEDPILEVSGLSGNGDFDIDFELKKGEILGFAGLVGSGRTELAKLLYGAVKADEGEIIVKGSSVKMRSPKSAIAAGIGYIPEDRKNEGAFLGFTIEWNTSIMTLPKLSTRMVVSRKKIEELAQSFADKLEIKTPSLKQLVKNLSGGNQQKVVLAKTLAAETDIIIFDEPTRGIDVGAKQEIYRLMNELILQGTSIIMISSEMEELIGMSDRILVMHEGRIAGALVKEEFSQQRILELASGI
ncbi:sugar ABC transporter ATP-binding protein [Lachnospiraceae bacterium ZAX-1]